MPEKPALAPASVVSSQSADRTRSTTDYLQPVVHILFALFVLLALVTPTWRTGIFTWWPLVHLPMLAGRPANIGILSLLPGLLLIVWFTYRLLERPPRRWSWGRALMTLPMALLCLLALLSLSPTPSWATLVQVISLALLWLVYLFISNERPGLTATIALVVLIQATVGAGQFLLQGDLGLTVIGEPTLNPAVRGTSVVVADGRFWLRAYGLTGHPNVLGATLAILILVLLPALAREGSWRRPLLLAVVALGLVGLVVSFSRTAWMAFGVGFVTWVLAERGRKATGRLQLRRAWLLAIVPVLLVLWIYRDLAIGRFLSLDTPIEATSLAERQRDASIAAQLIFNQPWQGVGSGNYLPAAQAIDPRAATVHNVPLLVATELGLPGLLTLLILGVAPLFYPEGGSWRSWRWRLAPAAASWVAFLVVGLTDVSLWPLASWHAAMVFGLVAGLQTAQPDSFPTSVVKGLEAC
jgi:hypothetical protein